MENIIREMIEKARYYDSLEHYDEAREMLYFVRDLIQQMAITINCPSKRIAKKAVMANIQPCPQIRAKRRVESDIPTFIQWSASAFAILTAICSRVLSLRENAEGS